jgi:two-component system, NtrC family, response regulator AtoC
VRKIGKFEEAEKGTLFLDEIAELDLNLQSKLLRVLQEREIERVGSNEKISLDVRLIIATHKSLAVEVEKGRFREDLYYRIIGMPIDLPPLRDMGNDVITMANHFADEFCAENKIPRLTLCSCAKDKLLSYNFPGNVRELKSAISLAVVMSDGKDIKAKDLRFSAARGADALLSTERPMREYNAMIVQYYLRKYHNNVTKVADKLEIGRSTIYKMLQQKEIHLIEE